MNCLKDVSNLSSECVNCQKLNENLGKELKKEADKERKEDASMGDFKFSEQPTLEELRSVQTEFVKERNWEQYQTPRNLLLALVNEVGELAELFQWKGEVSSGLPDWPSNDREHLEEELSDVFIYLVRLSQVCGVDLPLAAAAKIEKNKKKYPVEKFYGSTKKYNQM